MDNVVLLWPIISILYQLGFHARHINFLSFSSPLSRSSSKVLISLLQNLEDHRKERIYYVSGYYIYLSLLAPFYWSPLIQKDLETQLAQHSSVYLIQKSVLRNSSLVQLLDVTRSIKNRNSRGCPVSDHSSDLALTPTTVLSSCIIKGLRRLLSLIPYI